MRILVIADYLPFPLIGGDRIRIYNLLRRLALTNEVSFAGFLEKPEDNAGVPHLKEFCKHVETVKFPQESYAVKMAGMFKYGFRENRPNYFSYIQEN